MTPLRISLALAAALAALAAAHAYGYQRSKPGEFDYYALVLGWAPTYCRGEGRLRHDAECDTYVPHAFVLHGLWPQFAKGWPENCQTGSRPWVPNSVIDDMRDLMPNKNLVIHEYRVHGTCSGLDPAQYFGVARDLYERIKVPERFRAPTAPSSLSADEIEQEFIAANPWLKPDMMAVSCRGPNFLDIRVCFGHDLFPQACGPNEDESRLCPASTIVVPPIAR
jgi:ribonuclease T2